MIKKEYRKYFNESFFESIDSEIKAYLLGFVFADGCVINRMRGGILGNEYGLQLNVAEKDKNIIYLFQQYIYPYSNINITSSSIIRNKYIRKPQYRIAFYSKTLFNDLNNLGCEKRKTYKENNIPNIPNNLIIHFIRGYFDGDGSVSLSTHRTCHKNKIYEYPYLNVAIVSKTITILNDIQNFLLYNDIKSSITYSNSKKYYEFRIHANESKLKLFELMYKDASFFFKRKYDIFKKIYKIMLS